MASSSSVSETRSFVFEIDLNEIPTSPTPVEETTELVRKCLSGKPKESFKAPAELPSKGRKGPCVCGREEARGGVIVCDGCERWFHLTCAGMRSRQAVVLEDWVCGICVGNGVGSKRWRLGRTVGVLGLRGRGNGGGVLPLDINALPPSDGEGEGYEEGLSERLAHAGTYPSLKSKTLALDLLKRSVPYLRISYRNLSIDRLRMVLGWAVTDLCVGFQLMQIVFWLFASDENPSSSSLAYSNLWNASNGYDMGSGMMTHPINLGCEGIMSNSLTMSRSFEEGDMSSQHGGTRRSSNANTKLRKKELARMSRANCSKEKLEVYRSSRAGEFPEVVMEPAFGDNARSAEAGADGNGGSLSQQLNDMLPVQYEDFFVLQLGKIDMRPSYHIRTQIWPVGYQSSWHDKFTGSIFTCVVLDGGDNGPVFKVRRYPCSTALISSGSTILFTTTGRLEAYNKVESDAVSTSNIGREEDDTVQMYLSDPDPRGQDLLSCLGSDKNEAYNWDGMPSQSSILLASSSESLPENIGSRDEIGEYCVEGRSTSMVWAEVTEKLVGACCEVFNKSGSLQLYCKHELGRRDSGSMNNNSDGMLGALTKFCSMSGPVNIPHVIQNVNELDTSCKALSKWLEQDRFGLDVEFVQELIVQLPGSHSCSAYEFPYKKKNHSILQKRKSGIHGEDVLAFDNLLKDYKRPRRQGSLQTHEKDVQFPPPGKPLSAKLSAELVSDILQICEFLWRFYEILGMSEPISFEELEEELVNPWSDGSKYLEKIEKEIQDTKIFSRGNDDTIIRSLSAKGESTAAGPGENITSFITVETGSAKEATQARQASRTYYKCTGVALTNVHSSLLKVLVGELQAKVAPLADPNFDAGESKSKRGRKKDVDSSFLLKTSKIEMLPVNELTWPELARRYVLAVLSMDSNFDSSETSNQEGGKVFRCLQGDGGVLCGALTGVAGMEADALLLAEATKQICGSLKRENDVWPIVEETDAEAIDTCKTAGGDGSSMPEWALPLEPVRKLPTNVGTRIRKCVYEALDKDPPEWARKILEHSISKQVYKGNASGPTKKAVVSVLADARTKCVERKPEKQKKEKGFITVSDIITKQCRSVLRRAAAADESRTFCNLLGTTSLHPNDNEDEGFLGSPAMVSRPLDFRTIDLRLAVGYYGGSHEAFQEDVREVWHNIRIAYGDRPELMQLAETLSQNFESLYEKEVLTLVQKCREQANPESSSLEAKKELIETLNGANGIPKAPWDEGVCKVCGIDKDDESVLLCDTCDSEYHTYCLVPPLARIPEGNWYCPSCVASKCKAQHASKRPKASGRRRQRRYQGENSRAFSEALSRLAITMGEKEYWEFNVEERILLLKFLCDEVLNSVIIRDHLDQCADMSSDLQQKLRSLSGDLRNLKFREENLASRSMKDNIITFNGVLDAGRDKPATVLTNHGRCIGQQQTVNNKCNGYVPPTGHLPETQDVTEESNLPSLFYSKVISENHCNGGRAEDTKVAGVGNEVKDESSVTDSSLLLENSFSPAISVSRQGRNGEVEYPLSNQKTKLDDLGTELHIQCHLNKENEFDAGTNGLALLHEVQESCLPVDSEQTHLKEHGTITPANLDSLLSHHYISAQAAVNESETPNIEANSLKNEISLLMSSLASVELQLLKVSMRRDFLGRDSAGRLYWVLCRPERSPWLVVDWSSSQLQKRGNEGEELLVETFDSGCSIPFSIPRRPAASSSYGIQPNAYPCHGVQLFPSCVSYDSDAEIQELIEWLRDSDPRERDLRESIAQFQKLKSHFSHQASGNNAQGDSRLVLEKSLIDEATLVPRSVVTKAAAILEKTYGPCLEPETTDVQKKRGRKAKITHEDRLFRCECLEPIWPSRQHCFSCHQTFCTSLELEGHNDGKCSSCTLTTDDSKENDEALKGEAMMRSEAAYEWADEVETVKVLKNEKFDVSARLITFQKEKMVCPYNVEEISRKFITKDSNKELAKEIGLLGSNGIPSFVPSTSLCIHDPTLILDPAQRGHAGICVSPTTLEMDSSHGKSEANPNITNRSPKRSTVSAIQEVSKTEGPKAESLVDKDPITTPELDAAETGIVPISALRPLVGKASQILRRLKINLLEIDAVLPEEAFRLTKAHSSNRGSWRAFVKSAQSILEIVKAEIVFEDMVKTAYLRSGWWYWSSLSAAARTPTLSSLALRIYALDAALIYEKTPLGPDGSPSADNLKSGKKRKGNEG
ncbi:hypothetical protein IFM89_036020 [Coptis chinensis]|uniref:Methyl-CpG-binding domain-containing protein 9 n=1 Tax=Coptis chinensis TaxID=261450 RepID=A0A835ITD4_9MAGN|nr:hypothetical protein IFM89_036020 [Coptis chinensis]